MRYPQPDFILIGAMKCGTTTLHDQLAVQPGFHMSVPKEPNFFSDDEIFARGEEWYRGLFATAAPDDLRGESSTHYTKLPDHPLALPRLQAMLGSDLRFIYAMRHPVDRLVSHYVHAWSENRVPRNIDKAIGRMPELVNYGLYSMQLRPWLEAFGPERILPVFFESLVRRPQLEIERVCAFLGYTHAPVWRAELGARNVSAERLRRSALRDLVIDFYPLQWVRRRLVPQGVRDLIKRLWMLRRRPTIAHALRSELEARFDQDLAELGRWLGWELCCASFRELALAEVPCWVTGRTPGS